MSDRRGVRDNCWLASLERQQIYHVSGSLKHSSPKQKAYYHRSYSMTPSSLGLYTDPTGVRMWQLQTAQFIPFTEMAKFLRILSEKLTSGCTKIARMSRRPSRLLRFYETGFYREMKQNEENGHWYPIFYSTRSIRCPFVVYVYEPVSLSIYQCYLREQARKRKLKTTAIRSLEYKTVKKTIMYM